MVTAEKSGRMAKKEKPAKVDKRPVDPIAAVFGGNENADLRSAIQMIEKQFGEGSIMPLGAESDKRIEGIPTGSLSLDIALGGQGIPRGRIIEIFGPESSGKTTLMLHAIRVVVLPFTSFFDTFVTPVVVFFLFKDLREERARRFVLLFHALMMLNSVLGIVEFATGWRLTPIVASGMVIEDEWRSSALLGHPLANASLTGSYILALALGAARDLPRPMAAIALVLSVCGMVVFGGRASSIFLLAMLLALGGLRFLHILRGGRFNTRNVLAVLISLPVLAAVVFGLLEGGFFDRFIERFVDDQGSASTRIEMFELFKHISFSELLLAPDAAQMATLRSLYGLDFGIESFWVSFVLSYGLIPGLFFFAGLLAFCRDVVRSLRPGGTWVMVFFFAVASTSVSLSAKTPLFAVFMLMLLVLLRKRQPQAVAQAQAPSQLRPARLRGTLHHA